MEYTLKKPCPKCPFRTDVPSYLKRGRAEGIVDEITRDRSGGFICHETAESLGHDCGEKHCAGALVVLEHEGRPHQMMRIAERLGMYDRNALDMTSPVFETLEAFVEHHDA